MKYKIIERWDDITVRLSSDYAYNIVSILRGEIREQMIRGVDKKISYLNDDLHLMLSVLIENELF